MSTRLDDPALDAIFREARTYSKWQPRPVADDMLRELYDLLKWAPHQNAPIPIGPARHCPIPPV